MILNNQRQFKSFEKSISSNDRFRIGGERTLTFTQQYPHFIFNLYEKSNRNTDTNTTLIFDESNLTYQERTLTIMKMHRQRNR